MNENKHEELFKSLDKWFKSPQGHHVAQAFEAALGPVYSQLKGEFLVQLGTCAENPWLPQLNFRHQWLINPYITTNNALESVDNCSISGATHTLRSVSAEFMDPADTPQGVGIELKCQQTLVSSFNAFPFESDSIDCIIAPMVLDAFAKNKTPLNEIDRILKPMGVVIFLGINPWSLWGAALRLRFLNCYGRRPASFMSPLSLQYILMSRGFKQLALSRFYYIPPVKNEKCIHRLAFVNTIGEMIWPFPAGLYCLIAQKYALQPPKYLKESTEARLLLQEKPGLNISPGSPV